MAKMELEPRTYNVDEFIKLYERGDQDTTDLFQYVKGLGLDSPDFFDYEFFDKDKRKGYYEVSPKGEALRQYAPSYYNRLLDEYYDAQDKLNLVTKEKDILSGNEYRKQPGSRGASQSDFDKMDKLSKKMVEDAAEEKRIKDENDAKKAKEEADAKAEAEYRDSFKGRLQTLFEDSGKRDAILSGISETMLETRYGKDVYGSRMADVATNVKDKLREEEALAMVKDQAILDMMKTQAETASINNPMQFLSNTQKNARDYATAQGAIANPPFAQGSKEWAAAYAQGIENMAMENLIMAPVEGIAAINEVLARNTGMFDEATIKVFQDVIANLTSKITGDGGATTTGAKTIYGEGTSEDGVSE